MGAAALASESGRSMAMRNSWAEWPRPVRGEGECRSGFAGFERSAVDGSDFEAVGNGDGELVCVALDDGDVGERGDLANRIR